MKRARPFDRHGPLSSAVRAIARKTERASVVARLLPRTFGTNVPALVAGTMESMGDGDSQCQTGTV
jgi:hypothetical protein